MNNSIEVLDTIVVDQIAAGEVVERPASVLKELIENSLDAGAKHIQILIEGGGVDLIKISDDGSGMSKENLILSVERFATSKLRTSGDLERINTYGFRGEALPSIASVSRFNIKTKSENSNTGILLEYSENGKKNVYEIDCDKGTSIEVRELFYNVPARKKFLKSLRTEANSVKSVVADFSIARPDVSFLLQEDDKEVISFNALDGLSDRVSKLNLLHGPGVKVSSERMFNNDRNEECCLTISGLLSEPLFCPKIGSKMRFLVNNRVIKSQFLMRAVRDGYDSLLKYGFFPSGLLSIEITPSELDVNVHPQKTEIRFSNEGLIFSSVKRAVSAALDKIAAEKTNFSTNFGNDIARVYSLKSANTNQFSEQKEIRFVGNGAVYSAQNNDEDQPKHQSLPNNLAESNVSENIEGQGRSQVFSAQNFKYLGQVFKLYLLFASAEKVAILDMHAAHERVTFYRLKEEFLNSNIKIQELLVPVSLTIDCLVSLEGIEEKLESLRLIGIEAELRNNEILVRGISPLLKEGRVSDLLVEILDKAPAEGIQAELGKYLDSYISRLACHASIRRGREIKAEEAYELMSQLEQADLSGWCPHGRPVIWWLNENDLEKEFGRIQ